MLPIYTNASVLHKLQLNNAESKHSERISVEQTAKRFAIGDTGKYLKEVNYGKRL